MAVSKITLLGMYQFDNTLFDNIVIPEQLNKDVLAFKILQEGAEYPCIFTEYEFLKASINNFFAIHLRTFKKWCDALEIEYNPLENYNRTEEWTDSKTDSWNDSGNENGSTTNTSSTSTSAAGSSGTTNTKSAYDSNAFVNDTSSDTSTSDSSSTSINDSGTNSLATSNKHDGKENNTHTGHLFGNIGVTTSQQMLQAEIDVQKFNVYNEITTMFLNEFCVMVLD